MSRLFLVLAVFLLAACEATVSAPPSTLNPNTPVAPAGTPPTSSAPTETRVPTNTAQPVPPSITPQPSVDPDVVLSATQVVVTISPLLETDLVPPLRLNLPSGWTLVSDAIMLPGLEETSVIPFGYYSGPVVGGKGVITVLFGYTNIVPEFGDRRINLYNDALRLLLFTVIEPACEYSFEEERTFAVGGREARGTVYAANQCPDNLPSLQGWFATLNVDGLNFAFYAYTEPYEAMNSASRAELQAVLDSVEFDFSLLPTTVPVSTASP